MTPASSGRRAASLAGPVAAEEDGGHRVATLSVALLRAVMTTCHDDHERFAVRAGVAAEVIAEAVAGTHPAWALPYDEFTAIAAAVAALWPGRVFETAAACDLLLSCVLDGDLVMATDVLTEPCSRDLARALLGNVLTSETGTAAGVSLPVDLLALLTERAAALADSESPDAWVGTEILAATIGRQ
jgi:hypothetical protein